MNVLAIVLSIAACVAICTLVAIFRDLGYRNGMRDGLQLGHDRGKAEAHDWWLTTEEEIEATRREMWRERRTS